MIKTVVHTRALRDAVHAALEMHYPGEGTRARKELEAATKLAADLYQRALEEGEGILDDVEFFNSDGFINIPVEQHDLGERSSGE
jgi:hypothetical protein